jgi:choline dehydrogenase
VTAAAPSSGFQLQAPRVLHVVAGLLVTDASVMPTITSGNTHSPTLMIAERAARWLVEEASR